VNAIDQQRQLSGNLSRWAFFNSLQQRARREVAGKEDALEAKKEMPGLSRR